MFLNSVSTILVGEKNDFAAMSIAWATQVEREHVLFSGPNHATAMKRVIADGVFFVSLLAEDQTEVARFFGGRNSKPSGLEEVNLVEVGGHLCIEGAVQSLRCSVVESKSLGEQVLVTGKIEDQVVLSEKSYLGYNRPDYWSSK